MHSTRTTLELRNRLVARWLRRLLLAPPRPKCSLLCYCQDPTARGTRENSARQVASACERKCVRRAATKNCLQLPQAIFHAFLPARPGDLPPDFGGYSILRGLRGDESNTGGRRKGVPEFGSTTWRGRLNTVLSPSATKRRVVVAFVPLHVVRPCLVRDAYLVARCLSCRFSVSCTALCVPTGVVIHPPPLQQKPFLHIENYAKSFARPDHSPLSRFWMSEVEHSRHLAVCFHCLPQGCPPYQWSTQYLLLVVILLSIG